MRLLVLRHGRTDLNDKGYFNGQYDEPLNDEGREGAARAGEKLKNEKLDAVYCSPLARTRETAEIVLAGRGLTIGFESRLMERTMGTLDGRDLGMSGFDPEELFNYYCDLRLPEGFESWPEFFARVHEFLAEVFEKYCDTDKTVLLVTHAGTARAIYYYFSPVPEDGNIEQPKMRNCEVGEYRIWRKRDGKYEAEYLGAR